MKVAVTSVSGQLGSAIAQQLISKIGKENVVGTARTTSKAEHLGITLLPGDYNSKSDFVTAFNWIDVVMILSGMDAPERRVEQHRNIIHAARDADVRKIVYTSIVGDDGNSTFDAIVQSNRQTEQDIRKSGLEWSIGRNGLYIEPDVEYMETYKKDGKIANCASDGLCSYTTRNELAYAYAQMMLNDDRNSQTFNLTGEAITQLQLTGYLNSTFGTDLVYEEMTPETYLAFQQKVNGEFLGKIIAGIYTKIRNGEFNIQSDFKAAAGRNHLTWEDYFNTLKQS
ncbi:MAG: SDR family NAD(P)-dependent oxidoreductase [Bacteroidetes bacterium]|nr:MAG: SDR family NAD(P)-dependent oxidoreductase [Bacteroidota bacterium]RLD94737.1 MAG: SDR family NAD(P)-dependent oxidoreductase [Bacteroidota bacterium]RLD99203.1 MAG: SDR family NAD(P)-dependent oxidoreductase [Bacteroidota bacterium]